MWFEKPGFVCDASKGAWEIQGISSNSRMGGHLGFRIGSGVLGQVRVRVRVRIRIRVRVRVRVGVGLGVGLGVGVGGFVVTGRHKGVLCVQQRCRRR